MSAVFLRNSCLFAFLLTLTLPSEAGTIVVSGDSNIIVGIDGRPANQTLFENILGAGGSVGVLQTNVRPCCVYQRDDQIADFYNTLPSVTATLLDGPVTHAALAPFNLFVIVAPEAPATPDEVGVYSDFLASNGTLFLLGDNAYYRDQNAYLNSLLASLGSSMRITTSGLGGHTGQAGSHSLATGVDGAFYDSSSWVTGGSSVLLSEDGSRVLIAAEGTTSAGPDPVSAVPEPSTIVISAVGFAGLALLQRRRS